MTSETPSRERPLTAEEAELWSFVTQEAKALRRTAKRKAAGEAGVDLPEAAKPQPVIAKPQSKANGHQGGPKNAHPPTPANSKSPPPLARFDERQRRRLAREPHLIEARLDLHGMRQREAHPALRAFLACCAAEGHRHVLVITGKGSRAEIERTRDHFLEEPGVLRRLVPHWLSEPDLAGMVLSYTTASSRHGGDGALYVRLRKPRGS